MIAHNRDKLIALFDIGKTRSKLAILTADHDVVCEVSRASQSIDDEPYTHLDTAGTWQWMLQALQDSGVGGEIGDCLVVTHGATFALLDGDELAVPVMDYEFDGFAAIDSAYELARDDFAETRSPSLPAGLNAGRQIFAISRMLPDKFARVTSIVPYPQYWASRLAGVVATEATSLGSHTDLWRPARREFSSLVVQEGWQQRMPPRRAAWEVLGTILPRIAKAAGVNPDCRIRCGIHDSNASYLRHLASERDRFCVVSTGTWVICMAGGHPMDTLDPQLDMLANVDVFANPVPCARFMGGREFSVLAGAGSAEDSDRLDAADRVMTAQRFALPSFCDSGGPFPGMQGEIINPASDVGERRALASLYCALVTDTCLDNLGATGDIILEGRFVDDPVYVEALAHIRYKQTLRVSDDATGTVAGAARLAQWPAEAPATLPAYRAVRPAQPFLHYRDSWRELLAN